MGKVSNPIHLQSTASRSREIGIDIKSTGINWSNIAADIQEIAASMAEIGIDTLRNAARVNATIAQPFKAG